MSGEVKQFRGKVFLAQKEPFDRFWNPCERFDVLTTAALPGGGSVLFHEIHEILPTSDGGFWAWVQANENHLLVEQRQPGSPLQAYLNVESLSERFFPIRNIIGVALLGNGGIMAAGSVDGTTAIVMKLRPDGPLEEAELLDEQRRLIEISMVDSIGTGIAGLAEVRALALGGLGRVVLMQHKADEARLIVSTLH